jgi:hypothetical protein
VLTLGTAVAIVPILRSTGGQDATAAATALDAAARPAGAAGHPRLARTTTFKAKTVAGKKITGKKVTGKKVIIDLTGYSWFDNTPPGSAEVSNPILHKKAGGHGTYADPITVAVPDGSFTPGPPVYVPSVERYVIVEDSGASGGHNHLDMWVGGQGGSRSAVSRCMDRFTGKTVAEQGPPPGRPVLSGPIYSAAGCRLPKS